MKEKWNLHIGGVVEGTVLPTEVSTRIQAAFDEFQQKLVAIGLNVENCNLDIAGKNTALTTGVTA